MKTMVSIQNGAPKFGSLVVQLSVTGFFAWGLVAFGQTPAAITSPTNHASLSNPSVTFSWTNGDWRFRLFSVCWHDARG